MFIDLRSLWQDYEGNDVARAPTIQLPAKPDRNASALTWVCSTILPLMASVALSAISPAWATQPVSIPKPVYLQHQVTSPNLVLYGSVASTPFTQLSWPNPSLPKPSLVPHSARSIRSLVGTPFTQLVWPNPNVPPAKEHPVSGPNLVPLHGVVPFATPNWPNPGKPPAPFSEVRGLNLSLIGTIPFVQNDWPNPTKPPGPFAEVRGPNVPLQFVVAAGNPFVQTSWPNPIVPKPLPAPSSFRPVFTSEFQPFKQTQWPNPAKPPAPFAEVRGPNLPLQFVVAAGNPFVQTSWPNPIVPKPLPAPSSFRPVFTSEFQPFNQTQWPNPGKPPGPFSEVRGIDLSHLPVGDPPFKQLTWGVPPRPIVPPPPSIYRPQAEQSAVVDRPFVQTDWPNPIPPPRVRLPQPEQYFEAVYKPVMQNDWPLPAFPPRFKHDVIGPNLAVLHDMTNVPRPFVQTNWPLPWVPPAPKQWVIGAQDPLIPLPPEVDHPFAQRDWPLPKLPPVYVHPVGPWPIVILTSPVIVPVPVDTDVWHGRRRPIEPKRKAWELPPPHFPVEAPSQELMVFGETPKTEFTPEWVQVKKTKPRGTYRGLVYQSPVEPPQPVVARAVAPKSTPVLSSDVDRDHLLEKQARTARHRREEDIILALLMQDAL